MKSAEWGRLFSYPQLAVLDPWRRGQTRPDRGHRRGAQGWWRGQDRREAGPPRGQRGGERAESSPAKSPLQTTHLEGGGEGRGLDDVVCSCVALSP